MSKAPLAESALGRFYDRTLGKLIPRTHFFAMLFLPLINTFFYYISGFIVGESTRYSLALPIDGQIPLVEEWILVYFGCYLFWFGGLFVAARQDTKRFFGFFARVLVCLIIAFLCFTLFPLTIERPEVTGTGFFADAVRFLYRIDPPHNLFPSLHCFFNWIVYIQIRGQKEYPLPVRLFACLFSFAVFASTLFTRQHYLLDVIAGVFLAEASALILKTPLPRLSEKLFKSLDTAVFTKKDVP